MLSADPKFFHMLHGLKKSRINYQKKDALDYIIMIVFTAIVLWVCYRDFNWLIAIGWGLCAFMVGTFIVRYGFVFSLPVIFKRPQDLLYMIAYKFHNMRPMYWYALGILLLENLVIYLTPDFPHHVEFMRSMGYVLFFASLVIITIYRTIILIDHLRKKDHVREVLMQSVWKTFISRQPYIELDIIHAYLTGLLTHLVLVAPWFLIITYFNFSIVLFPVVFVINIWIQYKFLKHVNSWYYRDHWVCHNSELDFLYLHGPHHDAIPSGLIGVAGNGFLEGFLRHTFGYPTPFFNPLTAFLLYTLEIQQDIYYHQYIPGVYPQLDEDSIKVSQHSTHHFGRLEPYGFGNKVDQPEFSYEFRQRFKYFPDEFSNSAKLEEELTGFKWDNCRHRWYLELCEKYRKH